MTLARDTPRITYLDWNIMSENTAVETPTVEIPAMFEPMLGILKSQVEEANGIGEKIKTATTTSKSAIDQIINESDDSTLAEYRALAEKVNAQIKAAQDKLADKRKAAEEHAKSLIPGVGDGFDVDKAREEFMAKRKNITSMKNTIKGLLGGDEATFDAALSQYNIVEVIGLTRGGTTGGGTGAKKPRLSSAEVDGEKVANSEGKVSFTTLAQALKADVNELKNAAFKAAGTDDFKSIPETAVSFQFKVGDKTHTVNIVTGDYSNKTSATAETAEPTEESAE